MPVHELDFAARKGNYGCSRLGVLHGVDRFQDLHAWWAQEMEGLVVPPTKRQTYGKIYEEATLVAGCIETGIDFKPLFNKTIRHPEHPKYHLIGTPDGLADDFKEGGIECKEAGIGMWREFGSPYDAIPVVIPSYELQCRGYMALTGRPRWRLCVHFGGDKLLIYVFERDLPFEQFILDGAEAKFKRYFLDGERPPIGGNAISTEYLKWKFPSHRSPDIRPATQDEIEQLREYGKVRAQHKAVEKRMDELEDKLREAVGDREGLDWPGGKFTWRKTKDSRKVDWMSMAIALRTAFIRDPDPQAQEEARKKVTDDHTRVVAGYRRIYYRSDEFEEDEEAATAA